MSCSKQNCQENEIFLIIDTNQYAKIQIYLENLMKHLTITLLCSMLFYIAPAFAGTGHSHGPTKEQPPVSSEVTASRALEIVKELASAGKIEATWVGLKESKVEQKTFNNRQEWVVTYKNKEISDVSKQTLYLFFTLSGDYIAANYSGT